MNNGIHYSSYQRDSEPGGYQRDSERSNGSNIADAVVDTMVRWPMRLTGATMDFMLQGVQRITGSNDRDGLNTTHRTGSDTMHTSSSSTSKSTPNKDSSWSSVFSTSNEAVTDQDLSGEDLKYVIWSIIFTKPGHETILQKQQEELVAYAADANSYAGVKIARFLEGARNGQMERPVAWTDRDYASDSSRTTSSATSTGGTSVSSSGSSRQERKTASESGWRIPSEDEKYIVFLYKVDRRVPQQDEVTHVDRIAVEYGTKVI